jgi:diguanylate cyclase (GGDEF)-like protein/PAS domain S-box-containing protein
MLQRVEHFICICEDSMIIWINDSGLRLLQAPNPDSVLGCPISTFIADDFIELFADGLNLLGDEEQGVPLNILTTTADIIDVNLHVSCLPSNDGHEYHFIECQDISDLIRASQATRGREQRINAILKAVDQAVISIDEFGIIKSVNDVAVKIFGYGKPAMMGHNINMLMPEPHHSNHNDYLIRYQSTGHSRVIDQTTEAEGLRADGSVFPIELTVTEVSENNGRSTYVGSMRDITTQKAQEERIRFLALNDSLTGLPNRASFNDKITEAVARSKRNKCGLALMFIDLDKFKPINDTLGHEAGDIVLKTVAQRLEKLIRKTDTAARLGGDEFVLILENIDNAEGAALIAKNILEKIPQPIAVTDTTCSVGVSIGISLYPGDAKTIPDLLSAADKAMYDVKAAGRNNFAFFQAK